MKNLNKSSGQARLQRGQASRVLLILAIVIFIAAIVVYIVMKAAEKAPQPALPNTTTEPKAVYEATIGDVKLTFQDAKDMGNTLFGSQSKNSQWQKDITTTERFIKVTIGAQNKGKENIPERVWDIGNIIDSDGRNFVPLEYYSVGSWLPQPDMCGSLLKPEFAPISCVKIYEVSRISKGLKITVAASKKQSNNTYQTDEKSRETALIDLTLAP